MAEPTPRTSSPVAIGSSVPAWPTLRTDSTRRARATTSCEVMPPALSTSSSPGGTSASASAGSRGHVQARPATVPATRTSDADQPQDDEEVSPVQTPARPQPSGTASSDSGRNPTSAAPMVTVRR